MSAPVRPTREKRKAILALSAAIRMSLAAAITAPAPATVPLSAATTGRRHWRMERMRSPVRRVNSSSPAASLENSAPMMSSTSPPVQKARPVPVMMTARTPGSVSRARKVSLSSV